VSVAICPVTDGKNGSAVTLVHRSRPLTRYPAAGDGELCARPARV